MNLQIRMSLCLLAIVAAVALAQDRPPPSRPNILWISIEDTGVEIGCYGDKYAKTPNIDRLASQGVRFTRAFTHAPVCAPCRSGIITGMYPTTIGTLHMRSKGVPPPYVKCFSEYLRAAGYYCTNDNKTDYNFDAPLTAWDDNRKGAHWRHRPTKETPFFSVINLVTSHESQIRQPEAAYQKVRAALPEECRHDPAKAELPTYYPDTPIVRQDWARYYDVVSSTDQTIGKILQQLDDDGLAESTIVFFWGDHGRGLPRGKRWVYDSGIHVPLVVRWPGNIEPGSVRDDLVCFLDLAPTVLHLAGVEVPHHMQGQVILAKQQLRTREFIFAARDRMDETYDIIRAVRDRRYKYIRNYQPEKTYAQPIEYMDLMPTMQEWRRLAAEGKLTGAQKIFFSPTKPIEELYDTDADPHEIHNLADKPEMKAHLERLRTAHEQWMKATGDLGLVPEPELIERMRPGGKQAVTTNPKIEIGGGKATITCETEGASIAYRLEFDGKAAADRPAGDDSGKKKKQAAELKHWQLYTGPIALPEGKFPVIRAKACRIGFKDSAEVVE